MSLNFLINCSFKLTSRPQASKLQLTMMETMEAVELEKQKHNNTRMEVLARLAKLEVFTTAFYRACFYGYVKMPFLFFPSSNSPLPARFFCIFTTSVW